MATKGWAVALMIFCTAFTSVGQLFYKMGAQLLPALFTNWPLFVGLVSYGIGFLLMMAALRGGEVSVLYPIIATSFIWTNILATIYLSEHVAAFGWAGNAIIVLGVSLIGYGSAKHAN
jgi:drug/metabolite transporter (DMT)-like permease